MRYAKHVEEEPVTRSITPRISSKKLVAFLDSYVYVIMSDLMWSTETRIRIFCYNAMITV